jgi:hypothetical protein
MNHASFPTSELAYREMTRIHDDCLKLIPVRSEPGKRFLVKAKLKAWTRRDDIESELVLLREHVQLCYTRFIVRFTFSSPCWTPFC